MIDIDKYLTDYIETSPSHKLILGCYDKENNIYMLIDNIDILYQLDYKVDHDSKTKAVKLRIKDNNLNKSFIISNGIMVASGKVWNKALAEWLSTHKQQNKGMVFEKLIANKFEYQTPHSYKGIDFIHQGKNYECKFINATIQYYK